jgi:hypothetical protein
MADLVCACLPAPGLKKLEDDDEDVKAKHAREAREHEEAKIQEHYRGVQEEERKRIQECARVDTAKAQADEFALAHAQHRLFVSARDGAFSECTAAVLAGADVNFGYDWHAWAEEGAKKKNRYDHVAEAEDGKKVKAHWDQQSGCNHDTLLHIAVRTRNSGLMDWLAGQSQLDTEAQNGAFVTAQDLARDRGDEYWEVYEQFLKAREAAGN